MSFARYYDPFLQNSQFGNHFRLTFTNGTSEIGVPTVGSIINPTDNAEFSLKLNAGVSRIRFGDVRVAEKLVTCRVRAVAPHTAAAGDFDLLVAAPVVEAAFIAEGTFTMAGTVLAPTNYVAGAPVGTYKFVTVQGSDFKILDLRQGANSTLTLDIERED